MPRFADSINAALFRADLVSIGTNRGTEWCRYGYLASLEWLLRSVYCISCNSGSRSFCLLVLGGLACWTHCSAAKECPASITTTGSGEREEERRACRSSEAVPAPPGKAITSTEAVNVGSCGPGRPPGPARWAKGGRRPGSGMQRPRTLRQRTSSWATEQRHCHLPPHRPRSCLVSTT